MTRRPPESLSRDRFEALRGTLRRILGRRGAAAASDAADRAFAEHDARARELSAGHAIQCRRGCAFCCHGQQVPVSAPEALRLARHLAGRAEDKRARLLGRLAEIDAQTRGRSKAEAARLMLPCPFLEGGACAVYAARPLACRSYVSLDLAACKAGFRGAAVRIPTPAAFMALREFCAAALAQAAAKLGLAAGRYELHAAVATALATPDAERRWLAGEDVFGAAAATSEIGKDRA